MANSIVSAFRRRYPTDQRTDDELTVAIGSAYPEYSDPAKFPDFHSDLQRLTKAVQPQPSAGAEEPFPPFPPTVGDYFRQAGGSLIRGATSTLGSIPEAFGTAARIAGTYSVPGAEYVPMRFETEPGGLETALTRAGEAVSPAPVEGLEKSFLATKLPEAIGSSGAFIAGGAVAGAAEIGVVRAIGARATARALAGGLSEEVAAKMGVDAATSAAHRLAYGNIASLGALSQAQQGYEEARRAGADEHTRFLAFALNLPVGMTEAVPLSNMLNRLDKLSGGTLKQSLIHAGVESFEEALQNSLQGAAGDVIAARIAKYDPDRKMFDSLAEDAGVGGISGAIVSLAISAIGGKLRGGDRTSQSSTATAPPPPGGAGPAAAQAGVGRGTPPPAAPDVAAQYLTPEQKAEQHAAKMQETARRQIFGGFGADETFFVAQLPPNEQVTYQALVEQARKDKNAADQRIAEQRSAEERGGNAALVQKEGEDREREAEEQRARAAGGAGGGVSPTTAVATTGGLGTDVAPGSAGQPVTAPEKNVVNPPAAMIAPVVFHSAMVVPGLPAVLYFTPTVELRGKDGGIYKPGDAITELNLEGFTIPPEELARARKVAQGELTKPAGTQNLPTPAVPVAPQPTAPAVGTQYLLPPVLEAIAQKVAASKERLTADDQATLPKTTDPFYQIYHNRVAELRGLPPTTVKTDIGQPPRAPLPPPVAPVTTPPVVTPVVPPVVPPTPAKTGVVSKIRAKAAQLAVAVRKAAAVVHASPIVDTIDFEDSPLYFMLSGRGAGASEETIAALNEEDEKKAIISSGEYEGHFGTLVAKGDASTGTPARIKLENGKTVKVQESEYNTLANIRKGMQKGTGAKVTLAPGYFEIKEPLAANDKALQAAGLVSRASLVGDPQHGSRNSWTHRWTVFRDGNRVVILPTYKSSE
ncbi:MAG TPA: hypothetical protein VNU68_21740, partial [Verrucomicrobiae bacterium]|nr:hypothetical protein [Verrucomicrobiae bacterium]